MAISDHGLIGYQRAEFAKASKFRMALLAIQLLSAVPAAISVVITSEDLLYTLALVGIVLLVLWWTLEGRYRRIRWGANSARRAGLLINGLGVTLSPAEHQELRQRFTVSEQTSQSFEKTDYYASTDPIGPTRLARLVEESAFYSANLHRLSATAMQMILAGFVIIGIGVALYALPYAKSADLITGVRVWLAALVFILSSDILGAMKAHNEASRTAESVRLRLVAAEGNNYPEGDVVFAMTDYNSAIESAPEVFPYIYNFQEKELNRRWDEYLRDRVATRQGHSGKIIP